MTNSDAPPGYNDSKVGIFVHSRRFRLRCSENPANVPTGTFNTMFRLEHSSLCSGWNIIALCSDWNTQLNVPAGTLDTFCTHFQLPYGNSTLHLKCESHYSANSSGSSTIYGTCHRCCQSEGRRG